RAVRGGSHYAHRRRVRRRSPRDQMDRRRRLGLGGPERPGNVTAGTVEFQGGTGRSAAAGDAEPSPAVHRLRVEPRRNADASAGGAAVGHAGIPGQHRDANRANHPVGSRAATDPGRSRGSTHAGAASAEPMVDMKRIVLLGLFVGICALLRGADPDTLVRRVAVSDFGSDPAAVRELEALTLSATGDAAHALEKLLIAGLGMAKTRAGRDAFCRGLAMVGSDAAVPQLAAMLLAPDTSEMARYALERIEGARALAALR